LTNVAAGIPPLVVAQAAGTSDKICNLLRQAMDAAIYGDNNQHNENIKVGSRSVRLSLKLLYSKVRLKGTCF